MVRVAAMAIQNAVHRIYLGSAPRSTLMTGTTTQIMIDVADVMVRGHSASQASVPTNQLNVLMFAIGCGAAALLFMRFEMWCFILPPIAGVAVLAIRFAEPDAAA
jgi:uncharacterized membrane protein YoaK (UPF0700 family)